MRLLPILVLLMFSTGCGNLPERAWYAFKYSVQQDKVTINDAPLDCDWFYSPLGNKGCHYEKQVSTIRWTTSTAGQPIASYDEGANPPICQQVRDKDKMGDVSSSAIFFSERYFPEIHEERPPIAHLLPLAAHIVLMAGKLNPTGVGGLEIAVCRAGECRKLLEHELKPLRKFSTQLDGLLREQFRNAPIVVS